MRSIVTSSVLALVTCAVLVPPAQAQEDGVGGIIDWIIRMSGPAMIGPAGSYFHQFSNGARIRLSVVYRASVGSDDAIDPDGSSINALTFGPDVEVPVTGPFEIGAGATVNRFGGDVDKGFSKWSFPFFGQARAPLGAERAWYLRGGFGVEYFTKFDQADFSPLTVDVSTSSGEWAPFAFLGVDFVF